MEPNTTTDAKPRQQNLPGAYTDGVKEAGPESRKEYPNGIRQKGRHTKAEKRKSQEEVKEIMAGGNFRWSGELCKINSRNPSHLNEMC